MGVDDVTVDLGPVPLNFAHTLSFALRIALESGNVTGQGDYSRIASLKAMTDYRIAKAEKTAPRVINDVTLEDVL